jgi:hypothetical protein
MFRDFYKATLHESANEGAVQILYIQKYIAEGGMVRPMPSRTPNLMR